MTKLKFERKPLNESQTIRLINVFEINEPLTKCYVVKVGGLTKFEIAYKEHDENVYESIYARQDDIDFILNGCNVEREAL